MNNYCLHEDYTYLWMDILLYITFSLLWFHNLVFHKIMDRRSCYLNFLQYTIYVTFSVEEVLF